MKKNTPIFRLVGLIIPIYLLFNAVNIVAQTPGVIVEGDLTITGGLYPNGTPLAPNGDGYTSKPPS